MVVLIEPGINPIKLPVTLLAAKFMIPFNVALYAWLSETVGGAAALPLANLIAFWVIPDAFGFLFWETKENWSLYRANRGRYLGPVSVGPHGETVRGLLHPGFHSGTLPKLFARWRQAERDAAKASSRHAARAARQALEGVETTVQLFVERELVSLLEHAASWRGQDLRVGRVALSCQRIRVELEHAGFPGEPLGIEFEEQAGWLVASLRPAPWLDRLTPEQRRALTAALAYLYKLAGVELVREQIEASLPPDVASYDLTATDLVLWLDPHHGRSLAYDLRGQAGLLSPRPPAGKPAGDGPVLDARQLVFARVPLSWGRWVESWQKDQDGQGHPGLFYGDLELVLVDGKGQNGSPDSRK
jgi:hypothetical protein